MVLRPYHFDKIKHEYWAGERRLPSVSEIIKPIVDLSMVPEARLEFARDRGTAVHKATELLDKGTLDLDSVDEVHVLPYLKAYELFKREYQFAVERNEAPVFFPQRGFAGTPDRAGTLLLARPGYRTGRVRAVVDLKTVAEMSPVIGVQLSGYQLLLESEGIKTDARIGVQLRSDGTYRVRSFGSEVPTFLSLLTIWNWRQKHE